MDVQDQRSCASSLSRIASTSFVVLAFLAAALPGTSIAQCPEHWLPGEGVPGISGPVHAMTMWDPDGPGPNPPALVVGGKFTLAGDAVASNIAMWDGSSWSALGVAAESTVTALAALPTGELVAAGQYASYPFCRVAQWDGSVWTPLGSGMSGVPHNTINALAALPNGDLVAGGHFQSAGGVPVSSIARWNGSAWSRLGTGLAMDEIGPEVYALAVLPSGELIVGGIFTSAGGVAANHVAMWDGTAWSPVAGGFNGAVLALTVLPDGGLVAGGNFTSSAGSTVNNIARWDGASWLPLGSGTSGSVSVLASLPGGELVASGGFTMIGGVAANLIARWNGSEWAPLGGGISGGITSLAVLPDGDLVAGGYFTSVEGAPALRIARWNHKSWSAVGSGLSAEVLALVLTPGGELLAGSGQSVQTWSGGGWSIVGGEMNGPVHALAVLPDGDVVAGGAFTHADGNFVGRIARWNGGSWVPLGPGLNGAVHALAVLTNGDLLAGGSFTASGTLNINRIARWDGAQWSALGTGADYNVTSILELPGGDILIGGAFNMVGPIWSPRIALWNGSFWGPLGSQPSWPSGGGAPSALVRTSSGDLLAAAGYAVHRWTGTEWSIFGQMDGWVRTLVVLPGDNIVAGGEFRTVEKAAANHIAEWNGATWSTLGDGLSGPVQALAFMGNWQLAVGGRFTGSGDLPSAYFARWGCETPGCTADFDGSGGVNSTDISAFLSAWLADLANGTLLADFDESGIVNSSDISAFLTAWLNDLAAGC